MKNRLQNLLKSMAAGAVIFSLGSQAYGVVPPMMPAQVAAPAQVFGLGAQTEPGVGVTLSVFESSRDKLRSGTSDVANTNGQKAQSLQTSLLLDYNITTRWTALVSLPYVYKRAQETSIAFSEKTSGIGDVAFYGKYAFYKDQEFNARKEVQALAGIQAPTGSRTQTDTVGVAAATNQPGSGTTNFILGSAAVWGFSQFSTYGDATYTWHDSNAAYRLGNVLNLLAGINVPIPPYKPLSVTTEVIGQWARRDNTVTPEIAPGSIVGGKVVNSGGTTFYIAPGLQWNAWKDVYVSPAIQVPIYQNLLGTQLKAGLNYTVSFYTRFGATKASKE